MNSVLRKEPLNFAPVSGQNSTRLRIASGYFIASGILTLILVGVAIVGLFIDNGAPATVRTRPWLATIGMSIWFVSAIGWLWTGVLLNRRSRLGGILALVFLLLPLIGAAVTASIDWISLVVVVIGVPIIATVWNELS